jgi:hypothetical protein
MGIAIEGLALDPATKTQLLYGKTDKRTPLSPIYDLMLAGEAGD